MRAGSETILEDANPFQVDAAERYAAGRPYYHPLVMERLAERLGLTSPLEHAVDAGCGTGLSSVALAAIAARVSAFDPSAEMLAAAAPHERVTYAVARAEALPLEDGACQMLTLASVFHWLEREAFLTEARRVLASNGHLIIYDHLFMGEMVGNAGFASWHEEHLRRFPSPSRQRRAPFEATDADNAGFAWGDTERFEHELEFTPAAFKAYLLSQSNAAADPEAAGAWLGESLPALFGGRGSAGFRFRVVIAYLRRLS